MQFMIKALDGEGKLAKRMEVRPRHLEGMEKLRSHINRRIIQRIEKLLCRSPRDGHRSFSCGYKASCFQRFS